MRILLGHCAVDSGQLFIVDPCYADEGFDYKAVCRSHDVGCDHSNDIEGGKHRHTETGDLLYDFEGTFHRGYGGEVEGGVVTSTGFGDGYYPVYAEVKDFGEWGKRVASITVVFGCACDPETGRHDHDLKPI